MRRRRRRRRSSKRAHLIEQAEALGEPPEDPLLLFSVLYGFWVGDLRGIRWRRDARARGAIPGARREAKGNGPAHDRASSSWAFRLLLAGDSRKAGRISIGRSRFTIRPSIAAGDALWPGRPGVSPGPIGRWRCGCSAIPRPRCADTVHALKEAREIGHAATSDVRAGPSAHCTPYPPRETMRRQARSPMNLSRWRTKKAPCSGRRMGCCMQGWLSGPDRQKLRTRFSDHLGDRRHCGRRGQQCLCHWICHIWRAAYAELGQFDDARRCIAEAMTVVETTEEKWCEADVHRIAGEIALMSPEPDVAKAQAYFERALAVARQQQAKSWELRAAMSMARLWRDQGKRQRGPRSSRSGLRLVHRGSRYARLEAGQNGARRTGALTNGALLFDHTLRSGRLAASTKAQAVNDPIA